MFGGYVSPIIIHVVSQILCKGFRQLLPKKEIDFQEYSFTHEWMFLKLSGILQILLDSWNYLDIFAKLDFNTNTVSYSKVTQFVVSVNFVQITKIF